jgi:hypothetical protein
MKRAFFAAVVALPLLAGCANVPSPAIVGKPLPVFFDELMA